MEEAIDAVWWRNVLHVDAGCGIVNHAYTVCCATDTSSQLM